MNSLATPKEDGDNSKQGGTYGVDTTGHGLPDRIINHISESFVTTTSFQVLTNTVKDYDSTINGVTNNGQEGCNEGRIHLNLQQREITKGYRYVNDEG